MRDYETTRVKCLHKLRNVEYGRLDSTRKLWRNFIQVTSHGHFGHLPGNRQLFKDLIQSIHRLFDSYELESYNLIHKNDDENNNNNNNNNDDIIDNHQNNNNNNDEIPDLSKLQTPPPLLENQETSTTTNMFPNLTNMNSSDIIKENENQENDDSKTGGGGTGGGDDGGSRSRSGSQANERARSRSRSRSRTSGRRSLFSRSRMIENCIDHFIKQCAKIYPYKKPHPLTFAVEEWRTPFHFFQQQIELSHKYARNHETNVPYIR